MSFALENKHKQSRENIKKTKNIESQTINKNPPKKKNLRDSWLDPPLSSRLPQNWFFGFSHMFFVFGFLLSCYWFSQGFLFFPTLLCGVLVFFAAPPRSSSSLLPHVRPGVVWRRLVSAGHRRSHNISHNNISHNNISHTTSLTQHPTHNVSHTTSLTQHLSQQHLTHNITTSHTQRLAYNITHTTSSHTQHHSHNISNTPAALCCLPRGRMYALASSGVGWAPAQIPWQAQYFAACQGVGCTPWRRLASSGVGWAPAQISWQAQHFEGVGCTPWRCLASSGVGWAPAQISWQAQHFAARGRMYALASSGVVWRRLGTGADFVAGAALCCLPRGRMYALASSGVVWRRLGTGADFVAGAALCCLPRGRMYALASSGVVWRRLGTGADFVAGAALCCLPRGRMYALASSGVGWAPAQNAWQAQHFAACQGVGCTPWRRLASSGGWAPAQISWQAQHFAACQFKGSDVRPGVGWAPWHLDVRLGL